MSKKPCSVRLLPRMTSVAMSAREYPVALDRNGTVREERGLFLLLLAVVDVQNATAVQVYTGIFQSVGAVGAVFAILTALRHKFTVVLGQLSVIHDHRLKSAGMAGFQKFQKVSVICPIHISPYDLLRAGRDPRRQFGCHHQIFK